MVTKEKLLWIVDLLDNLRDINVYVDEIAEEEGFDLSYEDFYECIEHLKELVKDSK